MLLGGGSKAEPSRKYAAQDLHSQDDGNPYLFRNVTRVKRHKGPMHAIVP